MDSDAKLGQVPPPPSHFLAQPLECEVWQKLGGYLAAHGVLYRSLVPFLSLTVIAIAQAKRYGHSDGEDELWREALRCLNDWRLTPTVLSDPLLQDLLEYLAEPVIPTALP